MYERHPLGALCGDMPEEDLIQFEDSVEQVGIKNPNIVLLDEMVYDGWHRYTTALKHGIDNTLKFVDYSGSDPVADIIALNLRRRQIPMGQQMAIVMKMYEWQESGRPAEGSEKKTNKEMADMVGGSERTATQIRRAEEEGLGDAVRSGELSPSAADRQIREQNRQQIQDETPDDVGFGTFEEEFDIDDLIPADDDVAEGMELMGDDLDDSSLVTESMMSRTQKLEAKIQELQYDIMERDDRIKELENEVEFLRNEQSDDDDVRQERFKGMQDLIRSLRASVRTKDSQLAQKDNEIASLKSQIKRSRN